MKAESKKKLGREKGRVDMGNLRHDSGIQIN